NVSKGIAAERAAQPPFSHKRSLVGDFTAAERLLKALVKEVQQGLVLSVSIVIHPMERIEGGLSQIEERALRELAIGAGAARVAEEPRGRSRQGASAVCAALRLAGGALHDQLLEELRRLLLLVKERRHVEELHLHALHR